MWPTFENRCPSLVPVTPSLKTISWMTFVASPEMSTFARDPTVRDRLISLAIDETESKMERCNHRAGTLRTTKQRHVQKRLRRAKQRVVGQCNTNA